ncbi:hypothetical protein ACFQ0M_00585 [Kitasatospora aburaviensis]
MTAPCLTDSAGTAKNAAQPREADTTANGRRIVRPTLKESHLVADELLDDGHPDGVDDVDPVLAAAREV